jgi:hypothetical protein
MRSFMPKNFKERAFPYRQNPLERGFASFVSTLSGRFAENFWNVSLPP